MLLLYICACVYIKYKKYLWFFFFKLTSVSIIRHDSPGLKRASPPCLSVLTSNTRWRHCIRFTFVGGSLTGDVKSFYPECKRAIATVHVETWKSLLGVLNINMPNNMNLSLPDPRETQMQSAGVLIITTARHLMCEALYIREKNLKVLQAEHKKRKIKKLLSSNAQH